MPAYWIQAVSPVRKAVFWHPNPGSGCRGPSVILQDVPMCPSPESIGSVKLHGERPQKNDGSERAGGGWGAGVGPVVRLSQQASLSTIFQRHYEFSLNERTQRRFIQREPVILISAIGPRRLPMTVCPPPTPCAQNRGILNLQPVLFSNSPRRAKPMSLFCVLPRISAPRTNTRNLQERGPYVRIQYRLKPLFQTRTPSSGQLHKPAKGLGTKREAQKAVRPLTTSKRK
ncbi:hypothetical protein LZ31DRAFT_380160 [Colletotrichum somersetense]|nr:hypothetical protein LZ31DRAFT_380160 [Colletotrichum somersetense]